MASHAQTGSHQETLSVGSLCEEWVKWPDLTLEDICVGRDMEKGRALNVPKEAEGHTNLAVPFLGKQVILTDMLENLFAGSIYDIYVAYLSLGQWSQGPK